MTKLLEIKNIIFSAGVNSRQVKVSGVLDEGGVLNVCGPSGSGKTTLLRILARLREAEEGLVLFRGQSWTGFPPGQWRRKVHYMAQKPVIFDGTVQYNLQRPFELEAVKKDRLFELDKALELMERLFLSKDLINQDARTLSGGEASRLALVRAFLVDPTVLLLDEPLAALDSKAATAVLDVIAEWLEEIPGRGAVMVSHVGEFERFPCLSILEIKGKEGEGLE